MHLETPIAAEDGRADPPPIETRNAVLVNPVGTATTWRWSKLKPAAAAASVQSAPALPCFNDPGTILTMSWNRNYACPKAKFTPGIFCRPSPLPRSASCRRTTTSARDYLLGFKLGARRKASMIVSPDPTTTASHGGSQVVSLKAAARRVPDLCGAEIRARDPRRPTTSTVIRRVRFSSGGSAIAAPSGLPIRGRQGHHLRRLSKDPATRNGTRSRDEGLAVWMDTYNPNFDKSDGYGPYCYNLVFAVVQIPACGDDLTRENIMRPFFRISTWSCPCGCRASS